MGVLNTILKNTVYKLSDDNLLIVNDNAEIEDLGSKEYDEDGSSSAGNDENDNVICSKAIDIQHYNEEPWHFGYFEDASKQQLCRIYKTFINPPYKSRQTTFPFILSQQCLSIVELKNRSLYLTYQKKTTNLVIPNILQNINTPITSKSINKHVKHPRIKIDDIIYYDGSKYNSRNRSEITTEKMNDSENEILMNILNNKINEIQLSMGKLYMKDGILKIGDINNISDNYKYIVGVSKDFNTQNCPDSKSIIELKEGQRTECYPITCLDSNSQEYYKYYWYLRLRTSSNVEKKEIPFAHIIKCEILSKEKYMSNDRKKDVDKICNAIFELRFPTTQNTDERWRTHLYPIFKAEECSKLMYDSINTIKDFMNEL